MNAYRVVELGVLVAALAAPADAQQPTQVASTRPRTIDAVASTELRQPDQALYDAIGRLDFKKTEELVGVKDYAGVINLLREPMMIIVGYGTQQLEQLSEREQALIACSANELGIALRRGQKDDRTAYGFFKLAVDLNVDVQIVDPNGNRGTPLLNMGISSYNLGNLIEAEQIANRYISEGWPKGKLAEELRTRAIVNR